MIHTDDNAHRDDALSKSLFSYGEDYASYVYGNVFVAVINATADGSVLRQNLNQMSIDAKTSGTKWQILSIRESTFTTDAEQVNKILESLLPSAAEKAGIDLVLSAAECNYARTDAVRKGQATEKNGVIYMICGSAAEKNAVENAEGFAVTSDSYNALYVSVSATADALSVRTYNVLADGTVEEIDSISRTHFVCEEGTHIYRYGQDPNGDLICEYCDHTRSLDNYVGILAMSDFYMYYVGGGFYRGWVTYGGSTYFFDRSMFVAVDGVQVIDGNTFVFKDYVLVEGAWIEEDGVRKLLWGKDTLKSTWHEQAGVTYYFLEDGAMATGSVEIESVNENGETVVEVYLFDENGALIGKQ
jgi:glucan-binding YG repeat protein